MIIPYAAGYSVCKSIYCENELILTLILFQNCHICQCLVLSIRHLLYVFTLFLFYFMHFHICPYAAVAVVITATCIHNCKKRGLHKMQHPSLKLTLFFIGPL